MRRWLLRGGAGLAWLALPFASGPAIAAEGSASDLVQGLAALGDGDLIRFEPHRLGQPVRLELAARVRVPAPHLIRLLADPATYRRAVPAFVRADTLRRAGGGAGIGPARLLAWELEIPLWNLEGQLWLRPRADGATLELTTGDLTPGRFTLTVVAEGSGSLLLLQGGANLKDASWVTRRLAARQAQAEPAMAVAASYVLLRALVLEAERGGGAELPARRPRAPPRAPALAELDGQKLAAAVAAVGPLAGGGALAAVRSRPDGRLRSAQLGVPARLEAARLQAALSQPSPWRALPGWREIDVRPGAPGGGTVWEVDATFPFVDFDAHWWVATQPRFRAAARGGDWQGAVMGWDLLPPRAGATGGCLAVFSSHPRVDETGYLPRKLIEAEPLLEHGLALGLAYVQALSLLYAIEAR